jgi:hypothetical protein
MSEKTVRRYRGRELPKTIERSIMTPIALLHFKSDISDDDLALLFKGVQNLQKHISCLVAVSEARTRAPITAATFNLEITGPRPQGVAMI